MSFSQPPRETQYSSPHHNKQTTASVSCNERIIQINEDLQVETKDAETKTSNSLLPDSSVSMTTMNQDTEDSGQNSSAVTQSQVQSSLASSNEKLAICILEILNSSLKADTLAK